jgi:hypothetical protein
MAGMEGEMRTCTCPLSHQIAGVCPKLRLLAEFRELHPSIVPMFLTGVPVPACTKGGTTFKCTCEPFHYSVLATCPKRKPELLSDQNYGPKCRTQDYNKKELAQTLTLAAKSVAVYATAMSARDFVRTILAGARFLEAKEAAEVLTTKSVIDWDTTRRANEYPLDRFPLNFPVTFTKRGNTPGSGRDTYIVQAVGETSYTLLNVMTRSTVTKDHKLVSPDARWGKQADLVTRLPNGYAVKYKEAVLENVKVTRPGETGWVRDVKKDMHGDPVLVERSALVYLKPASATVETSKGALNLQKGAPFEFDASQLKGGAPALCGVVTGVLKSEDKDTYTVSLIWAIAAASGPANLTEFRKRDDFSYQIKNGTTVIGYVTFTYVPTGLFVDGTVLLLLDEETLNRIPIGASGAVSIGPSTLLHTASSTVTADIAIAILASTEQDSALREGRIERLRWLADSARVTRAQYEKKHTTQDALRRSAIGIGLELCRSMLQDTQLARSPEAVAKVRLLSAKLIASRKSGGMIWDIGREMLEVVQTLEIGRGDLPLLRLRVDVAATRIRELRAGTGWDARVDVCTELGDSMIAYLIAISHASKDHTIRDRVIKEIRKIQERIRPGEHKGVTQELLEVVVWMEEESKVAGARIERLRDLISAAERKLDAMPASFGTPVFRFPQETYGQQMTDEVAARVFEISEAEARYLTAGELDEKYDALARKYRPDGTFIPTLELTLLDKAKAYLHAQIEARPAPEVDWEAWEAFAPEAGVVDHDEGLLDDSERIIQSNVERDAIMRRLAADEERVAVELAKQAEQAGDPSANETDPDIGQDILLELAKMMPLLLARIHTFLDAPPAPKERADSVARVMILTSASAEKPEFVPVGTKFYPVHDKTYRWLEPAVDHLDGFEFERVALVGDRVYLIKGNTCTARTQRDMGIVLEQGEEQEPKLAHSLPCQRSLARIRTGEQRRKEALEGHKKRSATWLAENRNTEENERRRIEEDIRERRGSAESIHSGTLTEARIARGSAAQEESLALMGSARAALAALAARAGPPGETKRHAQVKDALECDMELFMTRNAFARGLYHSLEAHAADKDRLHQRDLEVLLGLLRGDTDTASFGTKGQARTARTIACVLGLATAGSAEGHAEFLTALHETEAGRNVSAVLLPALPFGRALVAALGTACRARPSFGRRYV